MEDGATWDATKSVPQTKKLFQVRGGDAMKEEAQRDGTSKKLYPLNVSYISCACDLCLVGRYNECKYLKKRGGVKTHWLEKKTEKIDNPLSTTD